MAAVSKSWCKLKQQVSSPSSIINHHPSSFIRSHVRGSRTALWPRPRVKLTATSASAQKWQSRMLKNMRKYNKKKILQLRPLTTVSALQNLPSSTSESSSIVGFCASGSWSNPLYAPACFNRPHWIYLVRGERKTHGLSLVVKGGGCSWRRWWWWQTQDENSKWKRWRW